MNANEAKLLFYYRAYSLVGIVARGMNDISTIEVFGSIPGLIKAKKHLQKVPYVLHNLIGNCNTKHINIIEILIQTDKSTSKKKQFRRKNKLHTNDSSNQSQTSKHESFSVSKQIT